MRRKLGVLALAMIEMACLSPADAAPGALGSIAEAVASGAIDGRIQHASSPRREKFCRDAATGNSAAAKDKSYKDCLKTWR